MNNTEEFNLNQKSVFTRLLSYTKPYIASVILASLMVLAITALELYKPLIMGDAIDLFAETKDFKVVKDIAVKYGIVLAVMFVLQIGQGLILQYLGQDIVFEIRKELFEHVQKLSMRFFDITPVGRIVTRVTNDVESLNEMFSSILVRFIKNIVMIIGLLVIMLIMDAKLALSAVILIPVIFGLTVFFRRISRSCYRATRTKISAINTYLSEHISGMKLIELFGKEKEKCAEFRRKSDELYQASMLETYVFAIFRPSIQMLAKIALVLVLSIGGNMVLGGAITIGTLYKFIKYVNSFFEPIQDLAEQMGSIQQAIASGEKVFSVMDEPVAVKNPENPKKLDKITGKIEFKNVWFAYQGEEWVLKDVSFTIEPGQKVAFVGATGAGKSSILNLIGRYYDIQRGSITIDGVDIREIDTDSLRSAIGQVQQDVFAFTGDIKSNIRLNNAEITDEDIKAAAKAVNASDFIEKLEHGYDEPVIEKGATLSAGQRQLLSFARTLAFDPAILVMDEATANIDTETETLIQDALKTLMDGRTTIMVAHRLSTIQHADNIIVMHKGRIYESGTHQELLAKNGIYKKLYEIQLG